MISKLYALESSTICRPTIQAFQAGADLNDQLLRDGFYAANDLLNCVAIGCGHYYHDSYYH